jgi:prepilin-type N-terminal cleavage/methylation domain-containing protein
MVRPSRSAFTLVEILIVVVILAILAAAIIPQFTDSSTDAKTSTMLHNLQALRSQIACYEAHHGAANPGANIVVQLTSKTNPDGTTTGTPTLGPYFFAMPLNPQIVDPANQGLVSIVTTDPTANITTHGWIYNTTNGKIFSGTDFTK